MSPQKGISNLFTALVVNDEFRNKFMDPATRLETIKGGYQEQIFDLSDDEIGRLLEAGGKTLPEVATRFLGSERK